MTRAWRAAACGGAFAAAAAGAWADVPAGTPAAISAGTVAGTPAASCELVLAEHRSGRELMRVPLDAARPEARIAFEHSVLGTTVVDRYEFRPRPVLVEERFDGAGYGLPHAAAAGERLERDGSAWRLVLQRAVEPLVVRPLPAQHMRLLLPDGPLPLARLGSGPIELRAAGCPTS